MPQGVVTVEAGNSTTDPSIRGRAHYLFRQGHPKQNHESGKQNSCSSARSNFKTPTGFQITAAMSSGRLKLPLKSFK